MDKTLLNKHAQRGAKIFRRYRVITFLVFGHFCRTLYSIEKVTSYSNMYVSNVLVVAGLGGVYPQSFSQSLQ